MHKLFLALIVLLMAFADNNAIAQADTLQLKTDSATAQINQADSNVEDDEFNVFLLFVAVTFVCAMLGAAIVGSFAAALAILLTIMFISAGVVSVSVFAGFYKKSVAAGFKTFIIIICMIGGTALGAVGLYLAKKIFALNMSGQTALLTGGCGGLLGGLLMGWIVYRICKYFIAFIKGKLQTKEVIV